MPIFERLRAQEQLPCAYPLHMGAGGTAIIRGGSKSTPLSPHAPYCHPPTHWVSCTMFNTNDMSIPIIWKWTSYYSVTSKIVQAAMK